MVWQNEAQGQGQEEGGSEQEIVAQIIEHCKKITEALYRVTDLFPAREPLKWALRDDGMKIFKLFISLNSQSFIKGKIDSIFKIEAKIGQIINLLEIASSNSFITGINFNILKREYLRLKSAVTEHQSFYSKNEEVINIENLPALNFLTDNSIPEASNVDFNKMSIINSNGHFENLKDIKDKEIHNTMSFKMSISENGEKNLKHNRLNIKASLDTERTTKILDIIKLTQNGFIGINEVYGHFKGISKKTIQRDLISLVREGILKMDGKKRWRRYVLNKI